MTALCSVMTPVCNTGPALQVAFMPSIFEGCTLFASNMVDWDVSRVELAEVRPRPLAQRVARSDGHMHACMHAVLAMPTLFG